MLKIKVVVDVSLNKALIFKFSNRQIFKLFPMRITINNQPLEVQEGLTIMDACNAVGIHVPSLCYLKDVSHNA